MKSNSSRRRFITTTAFGTFAIAGIPTILTSKDDTSSSDPIDNPNNDGVPFEFPSQDVESVREVVGASHTRFDRVKELVKARPALAKAVYDWGFGDWESAIGAASHMARRDIAEFLMEYGARPNLFTYAMLGKFDAVKSMVEAMPGVQRIPGPHGITLLGHAEIRLRRGNMGDQETKDVSAVVDYLKSLGDANELATSLEISEDEKKRYMGQYSFGDGPEDNFTVELNRAGKLSLKRGDRVGRVLNRIEDHTFAPGGAPAVRVHFDMSNDRATMLTIHDPIPLVKAVRIES